MARSSRSKRRSSQSHHFWKVFAILAVIAAAGFLLYHFLSKSRSRVYVGDMQQRNGKQAEVKLTLSSDGTGTVEFGHALSVPVKLVYDQTTLRIVDPYSGKPPTEGPGVSSYVIKGDQMIVSQFGKQIGVLKKQ